MFSVRRRGVWGAALALALAVTGCDAPAAPPATLQTGHDTLDGALRVWPARGGLVGASRVTAAATRAVRDWRTPSDDRAHLPSSGILWAGEVDGTTLALVAADVPGNGGSWLLQLTGREADLAVTLATEYPDPGYLVYSDVLPVRLPSGRRYLTSARVQRLTGVDGRPVPVADGLSAPVRIPGCAASPVAAQLRPTESLPGGRPRHRLIDLGTATAAPRYPLLGDDADTARRALAGLDTCALGTEDGPFGSVVRRISGHEVPDMPPASWPIDRVTARDLGEVALPGAGPAPLSELSWHTDAGVMTSVVLRPPNGRPAYSPADRTDALQGYDLTVEGRSLVVLTWRAGLDDTLSLPAGTSRLVDRPGLVVVPRPEKESTVSLATVEKVHYRSIGG